MAYEFILFENSDGIARLTLNRPEVLNSFNGEMHAELRDALGKIPDSDARVMVLTGAGRGFCAGQDLNDRAMATGGERADLGVTIETYYKPLVQLLDQLPVPTIAAVNGVAAGAGASVALACDIVVAAQSASFIQAFCRLGLVPDAGGTWILPRLIGQARALGMSLLGNKLPAQQAAEWGMIWQCVPDAELADTVDALARGFATAPTRGLVGTRQAIRASWQNSLEQQLDLERDLQRQLGWTDDYVEGVAAFLAKRSPKFTGR